MNRTKRGAICCYVVVLVFPCVHFIVRSKLNISRYHSCVAPIFFAHTNHLDALGIRGTFGALDFARANDMLFVSSSIVWSCEKNEK